MKPYYSERGITIYHCDCREILPQLGKFDLLLTDPPYGINIGGSGTIGGSGVVIGLLYFGVHPTPTAIVITLAIAFTGTLYTVWTCAGLTSTWTKRICFFLLDIAILGMIGYSNWPRVVVSPKHVTFGPNVSFSFTVKNQTAEDVYNVSPIMRLRGTYDPKDFVIRIDTAPPLNFGPVTFPGLVCKDANGKRRVISCNPTDKRWPRGLGLS